MAVKPADTHKNKAKVTETNTSILLAGQLANIYTKYNKKVNTITSTSLAGHPTKLTKI